MSRVIKLNLRIRPMTFHQNTVFDVIPAIKCYVKLIEKMQAEFSIVYKKWFASLVHFYLFCEEWKDGLF